MLSTLTRLLKKMPDVDAQARDQPMYSHEIRINDAVLSFALPHNFNFDRPMAAIPTSVVVSDATLSDEKVRSQHLWRGWWSFYTPGYLSREIGTLMMSIDVFEIHPAFDRDIYLRENFVEAMQINLIDRYAAHNRRVLSQGQTDLEVYLPQTPWLYHEDISEGQPWNSFSVLSTKGSENYTATNIPLDERRYLAVSFHEPSHGSGYGGLYTDTVRQTITSIADSLHLKRHDGAREISRAVRVGNRFGLDFTRAEETGSWLDVEAVNLDDDKAITDIDVEGLAAVGVVYDVDLWPELWMQQNAALQGSMSASELMLAARKHQAEYTLTQDD